MEPKFKKGDIITGIEGNGYNHTDESATMVVQHAGVGLMVVAITHHPCSLLIGKEYYVINDPEMFKKVELTYEELCEYAKTGKEFYCDKGCGHTVHALHISGIGRVPRNDIKHTYYATPPPPVEELQVAPEDAYLEYDWCVEKLPKCWRKHLKNLRENGRINVMKLSGYAHQRASIHEFRHHLKQHGIVDDCDQITGKCGVL